MFLCFNNLQNGRFSKYYKTGNIFGIVCSIAFLNGMTLENWTILGYLAIQNVSRGSRQDLEVQYLNNFWDFLKHFQCFNLAGIEYVHIF